MQNRFDRDEHIEILWENIQKGSKHNFNKVDPLLTSDFGTSYDYSSIMHYSKKSFSGNNEDTIHVYDAQYTDLIGQRVAMSNGDIERLQNMYRCWTQME
jgi:hypothetical protein